MLLLKFCVFLFLNAKPPKEFFTAVVGCFFVAMFVVHLLFLIVVVGVGSFCVCGVEKYLLFSLLSVLKLDTHARQRGHRHHLYSVTKWGGGSKFEKSRGEGKEKKKINFEEERTTTECKGTRGPPGVWNAIVCVRSSPSIETPVLPFLFARARRGTPGSVARKLLKMALWRTIQKKNAGKETNAPHDVNVLSRRRQRRGTHDRGSRFVPFFSRSLFF